MKYKESYATKAVRFRRFQRKGYAIFQSMHKVINIGVLSASTLLFALPETAQAQMTLKRTNGMEEETPIELEEVEVTASRAPIALKQATKIVRIITASEIAATPATSIQDLLEYAAGVDVRQRGEGGVQADISIRGGIFDQIAVLLNGINLSNPQTGHYSFDIPVNLSDIERIEIVSGPSSRIFGASAFSGAINIITKTGKENEISTDNYAGMHKLWKVEAAVNQATSQFNQRFSAGYTSSGGYIDNTDAKQLNIYWMSKIEQEEADFQFQAGYNDKGYGANSFYSASYPNQYDKTRRFFLSAGAETHGKIQFSPKIYWTRHFDRYELFRDNPADWYTGHNYHSTQVFGANLNATIDWKLGKTSTGVEIRNEGVKSNVLGEPMDEPEDVPFEEDAQYTNSANRTNISYFLEHNLLLNRFTLSVGVLANYNTSLDQGFRFYPGVDASYRIGDNIRLYGSWNKALRMPTFTDLYYEGPTNLGNPDLKPEESTAYELGLKYGTYFLQTYIAGFYNKEKNLIDWVKLNSDDIWECQNLTQIDNAGFETNVSLLPRELLGNQNFFVRKLELGYSFIHQNKDSKEYISNYALDYLKHKFTAQLDHSIWRGFSASWHLRWQDRAGSYTKYIDLEAAYEEPYDPYCVVDVKVNWSYRDLNIYTELNNLFDVTYYDIGNIPQPGFWFKAGFNYRFNY